MKILYTIIGILFLGIIAIQLFAMSTQDNIETYPYKVIKKFDLFEVRTYEATLFTSVKLNSKEYKKASSKGFSILAGYIFGGNDANEKIAMTSPVSMSLEDSMTMMFMVPKKYSRETLPKPNQPQIEFKEEPAKTVASITFSGWADDQKIKEHKELLIAALKANKIPFTDKFYFLGYNAPYEVLNRKNEVIVELKSNALEE
jgi:hypothetical protein